MLSPDEATIPAAPSAAVAADTEPGPSIVVASIDGTAAAVATTTSAPTGSVVPIRSGVGGDIVSNKSNRLQNTTICLPLVYGSIAFFLGKKADEYHTHKWCLYLRGPNDEDLSLCIQKVVFQLHPSFAQPVRELTEPPFEVTERGWGEFEAQIRIVWKDPAEKATVVSTIANDVESWNMNIIFMTTAHACVVYLATIGQPWHKTLPSWHNKYATH
jgi:YEATS domain-containing protein 4